MLKFLKQFLPGAKIEPPALDTDDYSNLSLPFEYIVIAGKDAVLERSKLLSRPGITPIIMGGRKHVALLEDLLSSPHDSPEAIIERASKLDVVEWIAAKVEEDPAYYSIESAGWPPKQMQAMDLSVHLDVLSRHPLPKVIVGLVPTSPSWGAPAYVSYGDWNDCPSSEVHVAMHKKWHEEYGSDIACMSGDIIECTVKRPPSSREAALALASEQFVYCSDIVHQGALSLEALAATLLDSKTWYFWWD